MNVAPGQQQETGHGTRNFNEMPDLAFFTKTAAKLFETAFRFLSVNNEPVSLIDPSRRGSATQV